MYCSASPPWTAFSAGWVRRSAAARRWRRRMPSMRKASASSVADARKKSRQSSAALFVWEGRKQKPGGEPGQDKREDGREAVSGGPVGKISRQLNRVIDDFLSQAGALAALAGYPKAVLQILQ